MTDADIVVIGGGIAGAGLAFELAGFASVIVLERESRCGYHATGRSAASFTENYGNTTIRRLAKASRSFLEAPPAGFADYPLLAPRGMITIARQDQTALLAEELDRAQALAPTVVRIDPAEAIAAVPILRRDYVAGAFVEPGSMEVDVDGLQQGYLRSARRRGARIVTDAEVRSIERVGERWRVETPIGTFVAPIVVNAAGAWADEIARLAGLAPLGLVPKRRTAFLVPLPAGVEARGWPLVNDVGDAFYFKHDAGQLFVSPSDATPSPPMDAFADDLDVAIGVERLERATTLVVRRVSRSWAGLRTFAADGSPVVGPDRAGPNFVWLAGQGGYGVKTAPALSRACASLIRFGRLPDDLKRSGLDVGDLSPDRLRPPRQPEGISP